MKTLANDLIGKLNPEEFEQKKEFRANPNLAEYLFQAYSKSVHNWILSPTTTSNEVSYAHRALRKVNNIYSGYPQLIYDLLFHNNMTFMNDFYETFLGVLCTKCTDTPTLTLKTKSMHFGRQISFNDKIVTFIGDVVAAGLEMHSGTLIIKGNVDHAGPDMHGGLLQIEGYASDVGIGMRGGTINIKGSFGYYSPSEITGGKIYVNDRQIHPRTP